jgi:hypothetical protein
MPQPKSPATRNAADDQDDVRTAEADTEKRATGEATPTAPGALDEEANSSPAEPDSHDDLVRRVRRLEHRIF